MADDEGGPAAAATAAPSPGTGEPAAAPTVVAPTEPAARRGTRKRKVSVKLSWGDSETSPARTPSAPVAAWATGGPSIPPSNVTSRRSRPRNTRPKRPAPAPKASASAPRPLPPAAPPTPTHPAPVPVVVPMAAQAPMPVPMPVVHTWTGEPGWAAVRSPTDRESETFTTGNRMEELAEAADVERALLHLTQAQKLSELGVERRHLEKIQGVLRRQLHGLGLEAVSIDHTLQSRITAFSETAAGATFVAAAIADAPTASSAAAAMPPLDEAVGGGETRGPPACGSGLALIIKPPGRPSAAPPSINAPAAVPVPLTMEPTTLHLPGPTHISDDIAFDLDDLVPPPNGHDAGSASEGDDEDGYDTDDSDEQLLLKFNESRKT
eukprot:m.316787 g.316787  ORF g.316787 m.316787 type:complete len:380 (-) comp27549_c0_seq2:487-1626(-)